MDKNTPLTFGIFQEYFTSYMDTFRGYLDGRFDSLEAQIGDLAFATKTGFDHVDEQFYEVRKDISCLKEDVAILKEDVTVLKEDVSILKQDVTILKQDVSTLKGDMKETKQFIQTSSLESASNRVRLQNLEVRIA